MTMCTASTRTKACRFKQIMVSYQAQTVIFGCNEKVKLIPSPMPLFILVSVNNVFPLPLPIP